MCPTPSPWSPGYFATGGANTTTPPTLPPSLGVAITHPPGSLAEMLAAIQTFSTSPDIMSDTLGVTTLAMPTNATTVRPVKAQLAVRPPATPPPPPSPDLPPMPPPSLPPDVCASDRAELLCPDPAGSLQPCYKDVRCSDPALTRSADRLGCNAGDAHPNCRFCGFGDFEVIPCPGGALVDRSAALSGAEGEDGMTMIVVVLGATLAVLCFLAFCLVRWCRKMRHAHSKAEDRMTKRKMVQRLSRAMTGGDAYPQMNMLTNVQVPAEESEESAKNTVEWRRVQLEKLLGIGRIGKCYIATLDDAEEKMVLRRFDPLMANLFNGYSGLQAYVNIAKVLPPHRHLVELVALVTDGIANHGLLTHQMPHTLSTMLAKARASTVVASKIRKGWLQVAQGIVDAVCHLHSFDVAHRMLHPNQVLFDAKMTVKLMDYGFPKKVAADALDIDDNDKTRQLYNGQYGDLPILYVAPEVLIEGPKHLTKENDVWAVGCLVARIASARELYESVKLDGVVTPRASQQDGDSLASLGQSLLTDTWREWVDAVLTEVVSGGVNPADELAGSNQLVGSNKVSPKAEKFVRSCCVAEPTERPNMEAVAQILKTLMRAVNPRQSVARRSVVGQGQAEQGLTDVAPMRLPAPSTPAPVPACLPAAAAAAAASSAMSPLMALQPDAQQTEGAGAAEEEEEEHTYLVLARKGKAPLRSSAGGSSSASSARESASGTKAMPARLPARGTQAKTGLVAAPAADDDAPAAVREHSPSMVYLPTRIGDLQPPILEDDDDDADDEGHFRLTAADLAGVSIPAGHLADTSTRNLGATSSELSFSGPQTARGAQTDRTGLVEKPRRKTEGSVSDRSSLSSRDRASRKQGGKNANAVLSDVRPSDRLYI